MVPVSCVKTVVLHRGVLEGVVMSPIVNDFNLVQFTYTNHKNKTASRKVLPIRMWFGSTAWHPDPQWLLEAFDIDKQATRDFAMAGIVGWTRVERVVSPVE